MRQQPFINFLESKVKIHGSTAVSLNKIKLLKFCRRGHREVYSKPIFSRVSEAIWRGEWDRRENEPFCSSIIFITLVEDPRPHLTIIRV